MKKLLFILLVFTSSCNFKKGTITEIKETSDSCKCIYVASQLGLTTDVTVGVDSCGKYNLFDTVLLENLK